MLLYFATDATGQRKKWWSCFGLWGDTCTSHSTSHAHTAHRAPDIEAAAKAGKVAEDWQGADATSMTTPCIFRLLQHADAGALCVALFPAHAAGQSIK